MSHIVVGCVVFEYYANHKRISRYLQQLTSPRTLNTFPPLKLCTVVKYSLSVRACACVWFWVQCDKLYIGRFDWHVEWYAFIWQIWTVVHCHDSWIKMFALNIVHCQTFMHGILVVVGFSLSIHQRKKKENDTNHFRQE